MFLLFKFLNYYEIPYFILFLGVQCLQPGEMSMEEIEGKLGTLVPADTITQLKSTVWKERLEGHFISHYSAL